MTIINTYQNGNCEVTIYEDGTKERTYPAIAAPKFPESLDVKITNWCDAGCGWCHEKSTRQGIHGDLDETISLLTQLPAGVEIAIGGGHPLSHPHFDDFVKELTKHGLICNVTINEYHFKKEQDRIERLVADGYVKGVGYSYKSEPCLWKYEHLVSHIIVGVHDYTSLENIIRVNDKVLLLGYKEVGRGLNWNDKHFIQVRHNINSWYRGLFAAVRQAQVSFDNLAISQLNPSRLFVNADDYDTFYMGNDGLFSMYVDAVKREYAVSSTSNKRKQLTNDIFEMFGKVKEALCE